ncbi:MAG: ABC transporter permease subunit [Candidatus Symbiobacter sp.]|nr:ABC transporter permease subunit [Candidatus Symbiobacter sp.]
MAKGKASPFLRVNYLMIFLFISLALLYIPIILMVVNSFNQSTLSTSFTGFTLGWYGNLFEDRTVLEAALLSLQLGTVSTTLAMLMGGLVAIALVRIPKFLGRLLLTTMITAPLVMPDVITGLTQTLLFNSTKVLFGWPDHGGFGTILIAHVTFIMAYSAVTIQSRLLTADSSLEEAAMDLGSGPVRAFVEITLPIISPALLSAWLLGLTLSLDDLVIASFVTGPGATTLPMIIYSKIRVGISPEMNALASIILGVVAAGVVISSLIMARSEKTRISEEAKALKTG